MAKSIPLDNNYIGSVFPCQYFKSYYFYIEPWRKGGKEMSWGEFKRRYPFAYNGYQYNRGITEKEIRK